MRKSQWAILNAHRISELVTPSFRRRTHLTGTLAEHQIEHQTPRRLTPASRMKILPLADVPDAIPLLALWFYAEWHDWDGRSTAAIESQLSQNLSRDCIPITFLAQSGADVLGTVSLDLLDLPPFDHLSPWVASLYVLPAFRRSGIGTALVVHAQEFATSRRISPLHLWTPGSTHLYEQCGWRISARTTYCSRPIALMHLG